MSDSQRSTSEVVKEIIERDGSIKIGLARGLINARALARYIQEATSNEYTFEALLSAVRRYPVKESAANRLKLAKFLRKVSMKNKISIITLRNRPEIQPILARFAGEIDHSGGETLRVVSTPKVVNVETDSKNEKRLTSKMMNRDIIRRRDTLSEVTVEFSDPEIPGLLAALSTELAMNGVYIQEVYSADLAGSTDVSGQHQEKPDVIAELSFIVSQKDGLKAYQALQELSER
jgi:hypothetical protein